MRILFAGKQHYDPGGIPASTDQLASRLVAGGHDIAVLAHVAFDGPPLPPSERRTVRREPGFEYAAYSIDLLPPGAGLGVVVRWFRPDVLVVNAGGGWWHDWTLALVQAAPPALPLALYVRDAEAFEIYDQVAPRVDLLLANAQHHADTAAALGAEAAVIPSVVDPDRYRVDPTGETVVFINPVPTKGVDIAYALAEQRPDVPFEFRESWHLPKAVAQDVRERCAALGNATFVRSTTDFREPYRRARLLLVPYEDANRPRVVPEAQVSGIPVLARDDPALREAVGAGGILITPDAGIDAWADGLAQMWDDAKNHARLSEAAREHSQRAEIDAARIAAEVAMVLAECMDRARISPASRPAPVRVADHIAGDAAPVASVIVPVLNVADTIDDQLAALAYQTYRGPWEIIVSDNGSTDATGARVEAWRARFPALSIVDSSAHRGVAHARNVGLRAARGDLLFICDGDDIVAPDWLEYLVAALDDTPIVTGFIDVVTLNDPDQYRWTGDATRDVVPVGYQYLPYAPGGNIGMWRDVFETVGDFDEHLLRAEDIDFGWRAAYLGIPVAIESRAVLHRRLRTGPRAEFRAALRGGVAEAGLYRRHGDRGMPRATTAEAMEQYRWLLKSVPAVARGTTDRYQWAHHAGKRLGRIVGSARERTRFL